MVFQRGNHSGTPFQKGQRAWNKKEITWEANENGCWICTSHKIGSNGYVPVNENRHKILAHRLMYERKYGKIPDGLCALHKCDVRNCVNPDHIFLGTYADNVADMDKKGRRKSGRVKGEKHGKSKLTIEQVKEIKTSSGIKNVEFARKFNVSETCVCDILKGRAWNYV